MVKTTTMNGLVLYGRIVHEARHKLQILNWSHHPFRARSETPGDDLQHDLKVDADQAEIQKKVHVSSYERVINRITLMRLL